MSDSEVLKRMLMNHFEQIFTSSHLSHPRKAGFISERMIAEDWKVRLAKQVDDAEISEALAQMAPLKSPGPDGIQAVFYKNFWGQMGQ